MKDRRKWACLLQLSSNWGGDRPAEKFELDYDKEVHGLSSKRMFDQKSWRRAIDQLGAIGADWVIIDILDGVKFDSHPELAIEGTWEKAKFLEELAYIRSLGMTPIPKLNFSTTHDAWLGDYHRMVGTKPYYDVCRDLIVESYEMFGKPGFFHLGMDEEEPGMNGDDRDFVVIRQGEAWWHDLFYYFGVCDEIGARPMMWICADKSTMPQFAKRLPKNVLCCIDANGYLAVPPDASPSRLEVGLGLAEAGYEVVINGSNWACDTNLRDTVAWVERKIKDKSKIFGCLMSPWYPPIPLHERKIARAIDQLEDTMLQAGGKEMINGERVAFVGWTNDLKSGKIQRPLYPGDRRVVMESEELVQDFGDLEGLNLVTEFQSFGKNVEKLFIVYGSKLEKGSSDILSGSRIADETVLGEYEVPTGAHRFVKEGFRFPKGARYVAYRMSRQMHFFRILAKKM